MLHLPLVRDGDRLEPAVRMLPHPAALPSAGAELLGRRVVEHEPRGQLLAEGEVVEYGEHVKAVADPMLRRRGQDPAGPKQGT